MNTFTVTKPMATRMYRERRATTKSPGCGFVRKADRHSERGVCEIKSPHKACVTKR
jgi:hypothetical protein